MTDSTAKQQAAGVDGGGRPVALVTGSRKGIGRHLATHLLERGYLVIGCSRQQADWSADGYEHHQADVSVEKDVVALVRGIALRHGRLDVVINNAAVASMNHVLLTPASSLENMLRINVTGTFLVSREAAKVMQKRRSGRIINFSSAVVPLRLAGEAAYIASKAAVEALSQTMANELAEVGITVNVVAPGPTDTDMIRGVPRSRLEKTISHFSAGRLTTFEDITRTVDLFIDTPETARVVYLNL
ncbi:MAG: SDR family NAD(P)-dependent oxidoreductase [Gemmatimonadota bacterium]